MELTIRRKRLLYCFMGVSLLIGVAIFHAAAQGPAQPSAPQDPLTHAGKQPVISKVEPRGGFEGETITIQGKHFGEDLAKVTVILGDKNFAVSPVALSQPDSTHQQEIIFTIPQQGAENGILRGYPLYQPASLTVSVSAGQSTRGANWLRLNIVHPFGLWKLAGISLAFVMLLLAPLLALFYPLLAALGVGVLGAVLFFSLTSAHDLPWMGFSACLPGVTLGLIVWAKQHRAAWQALAHTLFLDTETNTYSLSKCQAFAWTIVLIGSYLYFALGRGVLIGKEAIPDFNGGLLGLLAISYGGLVLARGINKINPKNDLTEEPPRLSNLITEGGIISLTRLQLVGFTLTIIAVFVYYVSGTDVFAKGLPEIPPTLNGLLLVSQGGYLGGKIMGDVVINYILPRRASAGKTLKIFGTGFLDKTKVLIQGDAEPRDVTFNSPTSIEVRLPKGLRDPGPKSLIFIPPTGSSFVRDQAFELIEPELVSASLQGTNHIMVTIECMDLTVGQLQATVNGSAVTVVRQEETHFVLQSSAPIPAGATLTVTTTDGVTFPSMRVA